MQNPAHSHRCGKTVMWLLAGVLIGGAAGAGAVYVMKQGKAGVPGGPRLGNAEEVDLIPADSLGFVHVRARDLWKTHELADVRKVLDRAGDDALKILDEGFVPSPSTLDRATLVILAGKTDDKKNAPPIPNPDFPITPPDNPQVVGILSFTEPFDVNQVKSAYFPNAAAKNEKDKEYFVDEQKGLGVYFPNNRVMVVGMAAGIELFIKKQLPEGKPADRSLERAIKLASEGGRHIVGAINLNALQINPTVLLRELPRDPELAQLAKDFSPLLRAEAFAFAVGIAGEDSRVDVRGYFKSDKDAEDAEAGVRSAAALGRKYLGEFKKKLEKSLAGPEGQKKPRPLEQLPQALLAYGSLGGVNTLDDLLANPPLKREGSEVILSADKATLTNAVVGGYAAAFGMLFDAVGKVREAAARMQDANNLKQLGLAMHIHHDAFGYLPPQGGVVAKEKGGLSWRVHLLPYIEQDNLYKQFKLDEPWDSENNKKLIDKMPPTFASPLAPAPAGQTYYKVFSGKDAIFFPGSKTRIQDITDGSSNTIMIVEGGEPVVWTKPDDIPFDGKIDPRTLALPGKNGINICMADGAVRWTSLGTLTPAKLAAAITRAGGEVITLDADDRPGEAVPFVVPKDVVPPKPPVSGRKKD